MKSKVAAAVSHQEREVEELRADPELAAEYAKVARQALDNSGDQAAGLLAMRTVVEAYPSLEQRLKEFDPIRHGGEVMVDSALIKTK